eukprot:TRINITY_DN641_c0_g1_i1.p1 TRINITY_DN641_c0_g1~~TRINITY_DN641_c0_g1_i1.p1  ORF type:complete len:133 (+),score=7.21 TRINITY_DN641_c0_g1_i1:406-804(+)
MLLIKRRRGRASARRNWKKKAIVHIYPLLVVLARSRFFLLLLLFFFYDLEIDGEDDASSAVEAGRLNCEKYDDANARISDGLETRTAVTKSSSICFSSGFNEINSLCSFSCASFRFSKSAFCSISLIDNPYK